MIHGTPNIFKYCVVNEMNFNSKILHNIFFSNFAYIFLQKYWLIFIRTAEQPF